MAQRWAAGAHRVGTDGSPHASARTSPVADGDILAAAFGAARRAARCTAEEAPRATSRAAAAWAARGARPRVRGRASMSAPPMRGGVRAGMARARRRRSAARTGDLLCTKEGAARMATRAPHVPRGAMRGGNRASAHTRATQGNLGSDGCLGRARRAAVCHAEQLPSTGLGRPHTRHGRGRAGALPWRRARGGCLMCSGSAGGAHHGRVRVRTRAPREKAPTDVGAGRCSAQAPGA